jgi:2-polyprenyl-3-methyl-5-hydroxy-6-metoxy-1,4-benzoquinol methylase
MSVKNGIGKLRATPEKEDFRGKYEEGKIGQKLLDNYFTSVEKLISKASFSPKSVAIEIGCGEGLSTKRIAEFLPKGMDLQASEYVKHLIVHAKKNNPKVKITQESAYDLKHKKNSFDLVLLLEVLEHLDYPDKALDEIKRTVKPGGYIIIGVPREPLWRALNMARAKYLKDFGNTPGHLNHWSTRNLTKHVGEHFGPVVAKKTPLPWTLVLARKK